MALPMNTRVVLASLPTGPPSVSNFRVEEAPIGPIADQEVLLGTRFVSVDAHMRSHVPGLSGNNTLTVGSIVEADGTAEVLQSNHPSFQTGQLVIARTGWQSHVRLRGELLQVVEADQLPEERALFTLGTAAKTAYAGLRLTAGHKPGETLVVPAATGLLAAMVGQFARMAGLWTVGIVSSAEESAFVKQKLGFHSAVDHTAPDFAHLLAQACVEGIDIFFETIGGALWSSVRPLMNDQGRVILAGSWAQYSHPLGGAAEYGSPATMEAVLHKHLTIGTPLTPQLSLTKFSSEVAKGVANGNIWSHVRVEEGLNKAPSAWLTATDRPERGMIAIRV